MLRDRHGQRRARLPRAPGGGGPGVQHRQPALVRDDLRPRPADQAAHRLPGRDRVRAARLRRRGAAHPERREGARAARLGAEGRARRRAREDDRVVPGRNRQRSASGGPRSARTSSPPSPPCSRPGCSRRARWSPSSRSSSPARARPATRSPSRRARRRSTSPCSPSASSRATRCSSPPTRSPRPRMSSRSPGCKPVLVDVDPVTMNIDPEKIAVDAADEGGDRRRPLRPAVPDRGAARPAGDRGRRRRARRPPARPRVRLARRDRLLQLPPAEDRDHGRGRGGDDGRRPTRRRDGADAQPRLAFARRRRHARAGPQLPALGHPRRGRAAPAAPARRAARGADAARGGLRRAPRATCR